MIALSQSRSLRLLVFGALYFAQGLPAGFVYILYVVFLTDQGLNNQAIGSIIGLMSLPWTLKILAALAMDRIGSTRFGRRRPFILFAELGMGATLLSLLFFDPKRDLTLIGAVLFLHSSFTAIQDAAADALAVELLQEGERGTANGVMSAARSAGVALTGSVGAWLVRRFGWSALLLLLTAVIWAIMLLVALLRERAPGETPPAYEGRRMTLTELHRSFAFQAVLAGLAIAVLTPAGPALIGAVFTRLLRADLKLSLEAIGLLEGLIEPLSAIGGALLGGVLSDRFGPRKVAAVAMTCFGATLAAFALLPHLWPSFSFLVTVSILMQLFGSASSAILVGIFMRLSNPAVAATQIAVFTSGASLTAAIAAPIGGRIADSYGVPATYGAAAALQLVFIGLLPLCDPRAAEARFRSAAPPGGDDAPRPNHETLHDTT